MQGSENKISVCRTRHILRLPCKNCIYYETELCRKTYKAKEKKK